MWRVMYTGAYYAELALKTSPMWSELEAQLGEKLTDRTGLLNFGVDTPGTPEGTLEDAKKVMEELKIPFTQLTSAQLRPSSTRRGAPRPGFLACRRLREVRRPDSGPRDPEPMSAGSAPYSSGRRASLTVPVDGARLSRFGLPERVRAARVTA